MKNNSKDKSNEQVATAERALQPLHGNLNFAQHSKDKKKSSWLRWVLGILIGLILILALLIGTALWWVSRENSLPKTLQVIQDYLPQGQILEFENAHGSLTKKGGIKNLRWQSDGVEINIAKFQYEWNLFEILRRKLNVQKIHVEKVYVKLTPEKQPKSDQKPAKTPDSLLLPIALNVPLKIDNLEIETTQQDKPSSVHRLSNIDLAYVFDGRYHDLQVKQLHYLDSNLQGHVNLDGAGMDVQAKFAAFLQGLVPQSQMSMLARLQVVGSLQGGDTAQLKVNLHALQQGVGDAAALNRENLLNPAEFQAAMQQLTKFLQDSEHIDSNSNNDADGVAQLFMQTKINPWRSQPVEFAQIFMRNLNARDFHPQAPRTKLHGSVLLNPEFKQELASTRMTDALAVDADSLPSPPIQWGAEIKIFNSLPNTWHANDTNTEVSHGKTPSKQYVLKTENAGIPVKSIRGKLRLHPNRIDVQSLALLLARANQEAGEIQVSGYSNLHNIGASEWDVEMKSLNLQPLLQGLPKTKLEGLLQIKPLSEAVTKEEKNISPNAVPETRNVLQEINWRVDADFKNADTGPIDQQKLPLESVHAKARLTPQHWLVEPLQIKVAKGEVTFKAVYEPPRNHLDLKAVIKDLQPALLHTDMTKQKNLLAAGKVFVRGDVQKNIHFEADVKGSNTFDTQQVKQNFVVQTQGDWMVDLLRIKKVQINAFKAEIDGQDIEIALSNAKSFKAQLKAHAPGLDLQSNAAMQEQTGAGNLSMNIRSGEQFMSWLEQLPFIGQSLPSQMKAKGQAQLTASWQGGWQQWLKGLQDTALAKKLPITLQARSETLEVTLPAESAFDKTEQNHSSKTRYMALKDFNFDAQGSLADIQLKLTGKALSNEGEIAISSRAQLMQVAAKGKNQPDYWQMQINELRSQVNLPQKSGKWVLEIAENLRVQAKFGEQMEIKTSAGSLQLMPEGHAVQNMPPLRVQWEPSTWQRHASGAMRLTSRGLIQNIQTSWLDMLAPNNSKPLQEAGLRSTLVASASWDVLMNESLKIDAVLKRDSGDVWLNEQTSNQVETSNLQKDKKIAKKFKNEPAIAAGLQSLQISLRTLGEALQLNMQMETQNIGNANLNLQTQLSRQEGGWSLAPEAPLIGRAQFKLSDLRIAAAFMPTGWRVQGGIKADVGISGQLQKPALQGSIEGTGLNLRSILDGVDLHNGNLQASFEGSRLNITDLSVQGGTGSKAYIRGQSGNITPAPTERGWLRAIGYIDWSALENENQANSGVEMNIKGRLERMQVLSLRDRQVTLSGTLNAALLQGALQARGDLRVDRATIAIPETGATTVDSDVVVVRENQPVEDDSQVTGKLQSNKPMDLEIKINLGDDFALEGYGATTRLKGEVAIRNAIKGNDPVSVVGKITTEQGRYRAWGQALDVKTGEVIFSGPYKNPALNILALRPNIEVRAGVQVTGNVESPRVKLYSDPPLPDSETLSWVVLGRAAASGGAEGGGMQQAALGLVAGSLGNSLGLDEMGLGKNGVSLGKRISNQLYVTYEAGLSGAAGVFYVFYDITRRLTARAQTGEASAVDLIYTFTYD